METEALPVVLITDKEYCKGQRVFENAAELDCRPVPCDENAVAQAVRQTKSRAVVLGVEAYCGPLYEALAENGPSVIARFGVGHDGIDKRLAKGKGIIVTNTPGALDQSVAELAFWLLGATLRRVAAMDASMGRGEFQSPAAGRELQGRRMLVVGFGGIGRRVAAIAKFGFGVHVVAAATRPLADLASKELLSEQAFLDRYGLDNYTTKFWLQFDKADIVTLHLPSSAATRHIVNAEFLSKMRTDAILINTSRGALVDESALYDALSTRAIAAAGLDVYEREPYAPVDASKDLRCLDNVVLTPHIASNTEESNMRMATGCVANVTRFLQGRFAELNQVTC